MLKQVRNVVEAARKMLADLILRVAQQVKLSLHRLSLLLKRKQDQQE